VTAAVTNSGHIHIRNFNSTTIPNSIPNISIKLILSSLVRLQTLPYEEVADRTMISTIAPFAKHELTCKTLSFSPAKYSASNNKLKLFQ